MTIPQDDVIKMLYDKQATASFTVINSAVDRKIFDMRQPSKEEKELTKKAEKMVEKEMERIEKQREEANKEMESEIEKLMKKQEEENQSEYVEIKEEKKGILSRLKKSTTIG